MLRNSDGPFYYSEVDGRTIRFRARSPVGGPTPIGLQMNMERTGMNGKELKEWRDYMGWSQAQAATALNMSKSTYQDAEAATESLSIKA